MKTNRAVASLAAAMLLATAAAADVETYEVDSGHSLMGFEVRHFVAKTSGRFDQFEGTLQVDPKELKTLQFTGKVMVATVNTNNDKRDQHLQTADFFDVEKHPELTFTSKKVETLDDNHVKVIGDLTMRGVTKEIALDVEVIGFGPDAWGGHRAGFEATGTINRKDFGISWNKAVDQGGFVLGDDVKLRLQVEAVRKQDEATRQ